MAQFIDGRIVLGPDDGAVIAALRTVAAANAARKAQQTKSARPAKDDSTQKKPSP